jgi:hypothetical protein
MLAFGAQKVAFEAPSSLVQAPDRASEGCILLKHPLAKCSLG